MVFASPGARDRRFFLASALGACACSVTALSAASGRPIVITILGDSITAGYGLAAADALPVQLQAALARLGVKALVRGAGVSGDTTAGGLARVDFSVQPDTRLAVIELGGNDLLQGLEPAVTRANLAAIARRLRARGIRVVVCGLRAPAGLNAGWARDFDAAFPAAARQAGVVLVPDLLAGVEQTVSLNQRDGIHPNPKGVKIVAANLAPVIARALLEPPMMRLFVAVEVPPEIGEGLARRQQGLPGARWRPLDTLHITLRFFGATAENVARDLDGELAAIAARPFDVVLEGVGSFGEGRDVHAVWAGVGESEPLRRLAGRCESAARRAGFKPEGRAYRPHVTLAYLRHAEPARVGAWVQGHNLLKSPPFRVTWFGLYSSWPTSEGSRYELEREYPLG